ncbi:MAG: dethiobiotin synthase [Cocleimonas sp.]
MKGIFITGTDTNVGKTWVSQQVIQLLVSQGLNVIPRKPVESGWTEEAKTDAFLLAKAANKLESLEQVCPNRFKLPISPDRAAVLEGKTVKLDTIKNQCLTPINSENNNDDFLWIEGAGGFYSPLCSDGLNADLAVLVNLPLLLVVEDRLGCINQTLLTIEAIEKRQLRLAAIVLNKVNQAEIEGMDNAQDLKKLTHYPVVSVGNKQQPKEPFAKIIALFHRLKN